MKVLKQTIAISTIALVAGTAVAAGKMDDRFKEMDKNSNGIVSHAEMMAQVQARFAKLDKDGDGYLTLAELPKEMPVPEHVKERMEKRADRMQEKMKERAERAGREFDEEAFEDRFENRKPTRLRFVARLDRDGDERVSLEEFSTKAVRLFKHADQDGNGELTKAEADEARKMGFGKNRGGHHRSPHRG
jgi:Ca2+-binding EF-hand superfamily protein